MDILHTIQKAGLSATFVICGISAPMGVKANVIEVSPKQQYIDSSREVLSNLIVPNGGTVQISTLDSYDKSISEDEIVKKIQLIFGRKINYVIDFDSAMNVYFFRVFTNDNQFDSDFDKLEIADKQFKGKLYHDKKLIVTLEDEVNYDYFVKKVDDAI